jgi:hypothetical protein
MYVVPHGEMLDEYKLPGDPNVRSNTSFLGLLGNLRKVGAVATWAGLIGVALYWLRTGRHRPPPEDAAVAEAMRLGPDAGPSGGDEADDSRATKPEHGLPEQGGTR